MFIELHHVTKTIKGTKILHDINLELEQGYCYGFVGVNGSGKTMLFRAICGYMSLDQGEVIINGERIGRDRDFIADAGVIISQPEFIGDLSGKDNLKSLAQIKNKISGEEVLTALRLVGLEHAKDQKYKKYSLGMKQRLRVAQAVMEDPDVLVLDEPFNGLDKNGTQEIQQLLLHYKEQGKTLLLTSHDERDIELLCDKVYEMNNGGLSA